MSEKVFSDLISLYPISKTIRFELVPIGKTKDNIGVYIEKDRIRAENYAKTKVLIDICHKEFIKEILSKTEIDWGPLAAAHENCKKNSPKENKDVLYAQKTLMKKRINSEFTKDEKYNKLFDKKLFEELLPDLLKRKGETPETYPEISNLQEYIDAVASFTRFKTYFKDFHKNRENIYSEQGSVGIPHRIVEDNFPKFLENIRMYDTISKDAPEILSQAEEELMPILRGMKKTSATGLDDLSLKDFFSVNFFNRILTQEGIDIYNTIVGGFSVGGNTKKLRGINEFSNLYAQQNKSTKRYRMNILYKQILSDRDSLSFKIGEIASDEELLSSLKDVCKALSKDHIFEKISALYGTYSDFNLDEIYVSQSSLTKFSQKTLEKWDALEEAMREFKASSFGDMSVKKNRNALEKWLKSSEFSINEISEIIGKDKVDLYFSSIDPLILEIDEKYGRINFESKDVKNNESEICCIKEYLDSLQELFHRVKLLQTSEDVNRDVSFYSEFDYALNALSVVIPLYNRIRNYITKKSFNTEKIKLTFENSTLCDGWDLNKERDNTAVIFQKNNEFFLGIMNPEKKIDFTKENDDSKDGYQKLNYKLLPDPKKMLPKVFLSSKKGKETYLPSEDLQKKYEEGRHKKGSTFDIEFCHELIDYFKNCINMHEEYPEYKFSFSDTSEYQDLSEFYKEVADQGYRIWWTNISESKINEMIENNRLYLFKIWNKDFSQHSSKTDNLHTIYWKMLFEPKNLKNVVFKLNGEAEVFFREKTDMPIVKHKAGEKMVNRTTIDGKPLPESVHTELFKYHNGKIGSLSEETRSYANRVVVKDVTYDITKDRRFTVDKILFHVPLTINFKSGGKVNLNQEIMERADKMDLKILGIDRGERNLLYTVMIDSEGNIVPGTQKSLNILNGFDYREKLDQREKERDEARKNWKSLESIKNLKEGYLSLAIHEISKMVLEHGCVVALEDLNFGFKRGRFKVEKQVYQKFERMLIEKLNYVVLKDRDIDVPGGALRGYQLTNPLTSFTELGKQTGVLFYVPAMYTSNIDPKTGFVNLFNFDGIESMAAIKDFLGRFSSIRYSKADDAFAFEFNYGDFRCKGSRTYDQKWTVYTYGERIIRSKTGDRIEIPTQRMRNALRLRNIMHPDGENLLPQIMQVEEAAGNKEFFLDLFYAFRHAVSLRNTSNEQDYILSPVKGGGGTFFDSRVMDEEYAASGNAAWPRDADANGAYNIALKGLYMIRNSKRTQSGAYSLPPISNDDWFAFMRKR